jgi:hypothetical protein
MLDPTATFIPLTSGNLQPSECKATGEESVRWVSSNQNTRNAYSGHDKKRVPIFDLWLYSRPEEYFRERLERANV